MDAIERRKVLGEGPIGSLMIKFAVPSIIAMLVSAIYNIVDQIFIGRYVGTLGNAATNIAFPLAMSCTAIGLLFGIGGAANFNLSMGRKDYKKAPYYIGNALVMLVLLGTILAVVVELFLHPMLVFFGSPTDVLPYAASYVRITAIGFPFLIVTTGGGHLIRADGSPNMTMICSLSGAVINTVLDAVFIIAFQWGMQGAALATIIGQIFSGCLVFWYMKGFKTLELKREHLILHGHIVAQTAALGMASCVNQIAMMIMQIILNNSLKYYGGLSVYGESIPLAAAGIVTKVSQVFFAIVIGLAQGSQPIESFNYGARKYARVRKTYLVTIKAAFLISLVAWVLFQTIPDVLLSAFGDGSAEYIEFGVRFFRIFLFGTWMNCIQPATSQFYASVGKPHKGMFVSLTRQILFLIPLILILPMFFGIDGIMYAGPIADAVACVVALLMVRTEFKDMHRLEAEMEANK